MMRGLCLLLLTVTLSHVQAQKHTISGYVKDKSSGEALIGANIYNDSHDFGISTNSNGFFSTTLNKDSVQLIFSYVGYEPYELDFLLDKDTTINVELGGTLLKELVISGTNVERASESSIMSAVNLKAEQINQIPALLGETDVLKSLQLLPGVQSGNEGASGIYVRGGGPDQNLILLDGVPIYNASHLFGFFSVFNADAIDNINLIKGGFPARYGGRLSSVVDISMREGNFKELKGQGSIGLISSKITLDGPIRTDRTSFLLSARRTYIDALAYPLLKSFQADESIPRYFFYDVNFKVDHKFSPIDHLSLTMYLGKDKAFSRHNEDDNSGNVSYKEEYGLKWGNIIAALKWKRMLNDKFIFHSLINYSNYSFDLFEEYEELPRGNSNEYYKGKYLSGIEDLGFKVDLEYLPTSNHAINFGANIVNHTFKPGAIHFQSLWEADTTWGSTNTYAKEFSGYFEDDFSINRRLKLNYGLHYSGFLVEGKYYHSLQPRISSRIMLGKDFSFKSSFADMTQYIHLLTNSGIGLPTDLWAPSTAKIKPQRSRQFAAGFSKSTSSMEFSLEGFYKSMHNIIEYKEGATFLHIDQSWQDKVQAGKGESYGMEVFAQKAVGKTTGWIGYTLSWTNREFIKTVNGIDIWEKFPYRYDRRHDISITMSTKIGKGAEFSWSWVFGSGSAVTLPISSYTSMYPDYSGNGYLWSVETEVFVKRNGYRMKDYHRLDLGISFTKETKWGERTWHFGTFNTYNRSNPYFIDIGRNSKNHRKFVQRSLFPIIPSVSYSFKF